MKKKDRLFPAAFALTKLAIHVATIPGYGYFRDEFYYLACSRRLDFGYVDHPPFSVGLLWLSRSLFGESLYALRLWPALAGAATVFLVGLMTKEMGGGRWAQAIAMTSAIVAPLYLALNHFYSMNAFDVLFWALAAWLLMRALKQERLVLWAALGLVLGLGLQNKISVLWLGFGLMAGLLLTSRRRLLKTPGPWLAGGLAMLIFLPHLIWQLAYDWPTAEFVQNATSGKMAQRSILDFAAGQIRAMNPLTFPIWLLGLGFLFFSERGKEHRILGWIYLTVFLLLAFSGTARTGYLSPAYTWLFAAGATALTGLVSAGWARASIIAVLTAGGAVLAPLGLPVLPVESYIRYAEFLGERPRTEERKELAQLPQHYADMHGWEQVVAAVRSAAAQLSPEERAKAAILTPNYGVAGAIELLGPDLPTPLSGHNNYWLWGPRGHDGAVMLVVGEDREELLRHFRQVELGAVTDCGYCMPYENRRPVWICRDPYRPLGEVWPVLKHYD